MNNFERLKNMTVEEMTEFIADIVSTADCANCPAYDMCIQGVDCKISIKNWLKKKASE